MRAFFFLFIVILNLALATIPDDLQAFFQDPEKTKNRSTVKRMWQDHVENLKAATPEVVSKFRNLGIRIEDKLASLIFNEELSLESRLKLVSVFVEVGADVRDAYLHGYKSKFYEIMEPTLSMVAPYLHADDDASRTLYSCLRQVPRADRPAALKIIAQHEILSPTDDEVLFLFLPIRCPADAIIAKEIFDAYLSHPKILPVYNAFIAHAWRNGWQHERLIGQRLKGSRAARWFDIVPILLQAEKDAEAYRYILLCKREGAPLDDYSHLVEVGTEVSITCRPILVIVAEHLPRKYRDILFTLLIPDDFRIGPDGVPLDIDLSDKIANEAKYGVGDLDTTIGNEGITYHNLITNARNIRAKHLQLIHLINMHASGEDMGALFDVSIHLLIKLVAVETGLDLDD